MADFGSGFHGSAFSGKRKFVEQDDILIYRKLNDPKYLTQK